MEQGIMRASKNIVLIAISLIMISSCTSETKEPIDTQNTPPMEKQAKQEIERLLMVYKETLNTSNAEKATSLYTKEGIFMPSEAPTAVGTEQIKGAYDFVFSQIQLKIEFYIEEIEVENNFAFATTRSEGTTLIHATGDTVPEANRELFILEKVDGEWKIARYMFNKTSPQK